jgi:hypothetical protein
MLQPAEGGVGFIVLYMWEVLLLERAELLRIGSIKLEAQFGQP